MAEELKQGALLCHETFRIEKKLGQGGFGITYLARDLRLDRLVAIKEFFPKDYCGRDDTTSRVKISTDSAGVIFTRYKDKFLKEARNIAKLNHPRIIKIHAAFEDNGTAYYVMEYLEGMSLAEMVKAQGPLSAPIALEYIKGVGEALSYVHARNINHLDIKPANIMVRREDNCPILIDFGLSKQYDATGAQTSTTPPGISHGYAPTEQYTAGGVSKFSPQTDIYSLAATLYYLLSGETPPQATQLIQEELRFPASIPAELRPAIATGMMPAISKRYPTVAAFIAALSSPIPSPDDATVIVEPAPEPEQVWEQESEIDAYPTYEQPMEGRRHSKLFLWGGIGLAAVIAVVLLVLYLPKNQGVDGADNQIAGDTIDPVDSMTNAMEQLQEDDQIATAITNESNANTDNKKEDQQIATPTESAKEEEGRHEEAPESWSNREEAQQAQQPPRNDNEIFEAVEQQAQFPGNLNSWLSRNLRYPEEALKNNIQGRVVVKFCVERDGSISQVTVIRSVYYLLDREAVRVVKSMPKWLPAKNNGIPVRSWYVLPFSFRL